MRKKDLVKATASCLLLGFLVGILAVTVDFMDDPIPAPGTSYRGLPLPWLKTRPKLGPVRHWNPATLRATSRVSLDRFLFDALFWSGLTYCIIFLPLRDRTKRIQNDRRRRGLCIKCGYNLTGNTTGTCPECGTKFEMLAIESPRRGDGS